MLKVPQIHYTKDYSKFKNFKQQRILSQRQIEHLKNDPSFPEKFKTAPIVVCQEGYNLKIIDGNHRFHAAKALDIPIFYIIDKHGSVEDMITRNAQVKVWCLNDYLDFYCTSDNENYKLIFKIMKEYRIPLTFINVVCRKMLGLFSGGYAKLFKEGKLDLRKCKGNLLEFFEIIIPKLKEYQAHHGLKKARPLYTESYMNAYVHFYNEERDIFDKFFRRLSQIGMTFIPFIEFEEAREYIRKRSSGRFYMKKEEREFLEGVE